MLGPTAGATGEFFAEVAVIAGYLRLAVTEEPVEIRGPVKAYVIGSHTLKEIFQCKEKDVLTYNLPKWVQGNKP
ncbi:MAG: hypothetical protein K8R36_04315 [Planctomycetales bacterium]|nr:hypothetical protein [Planctomycetales bacterium]